MIINGLDGYYTVFDTKNRNTELDTLISKICYTRIDSYSSRIWCAASLTMETVFVSFLKGMPIISIAISFAL